MLPADTIKLSRFLIGKLLVSRIGGTRSVARIVEVEAYVTGDPASHAFRGPTKRNNVMFGPRGHAYVYRIYGTSWCLNVTSAETGLGEAALIRALEPVAGIEAMRERRPGIADRDLLRGPGRLCAALGIDGSFDGLDLCAARSPLALFDDADDFTDRRLDPHRSDASCGTQAALLCTRQQVAERTRIAFAMRLQRYLALAGVASRRAAEELIVAGHVRVNGKIVRELGSRVEEGDRVEVNGRTIVMPQREVLVINKPAGVVTTMRDPEGRRTVDDVVRSHRGAKAARLVPVGRLDYDTSGVLLLTNDGDLAFALTHPRFGVDKVYRATLRGRLEPEAVEKLRVGVFLEGRRTSPVQLKRRCSFARSLRRRSDAARRTVPPSAPHVRSRSVIRLLALERLSFGPVALGSLRPAHLRELTPRERKALDALLLNSRQNGGARSSK